MEDGTPGALSNLLVYPQSDIPAHFISQIGNLADTYLDREEADRIAPYYSRAVRAVPAPELNQEQKAALERIFEHPGFSVSMLFGVTGSGKTEVYLQTMAKAIKMGKTALLLVPEISLTQISSARSRFWKLSARISIV